MNIEQINDDILLSSAAERVNYLRDKFKWNCIPMKSFTRFKDGKKKAIIGYKWESFINTYYPIENWNDNTQKAFAIVTGELSNLMILDLDSDSAVESIEQLMNDKIENLSNYIIKTNKGYQLFYKYSPKFSTKLLQAEKTDIICGTLSFADPFNAGYEFLKYSEELEDMPEELFNILEEKVEAYGSSETDALSQAIRENSDLPFRYPMIHTINEFLNSKIIGKKLNEDLKRIFFTKDYERFNIEGSKFTDFPKDGYLHDKLLWCGSLVAASPTVDKKTYKEFFKKLHTNIFKLDLDDPHEFDLYKNRVSGNMKRWRYEENWRLKVDEVKENVTGDYIDKFNLEFWLDPYDNKFKLYEQKEKEIISYGQWKLLVDGICTEINNLLSEGDVFTLEDENEFKKSLRQSSIIKRRETFDVTKNAMFFVNDEGNNRYNMFQRSGHLLSILESADFYKDKDEKLEIPKYINMVISNLFKHEDEKDLFLHNLSYHMRTLETTTTSFVFRDDGGTGKGVLCDTILKELYSDKYHLSTNAKAVTARFNGQFKNRLLIFIDEVKNENPYNGGEMGSFYNVMKTLLGNSTREIQSKGSDTENVNHNAFYVIASNDRVPFVIEDTNDRRYNFIETTNKALQEVEGYPKSASTAKNLLISEIPAFVDYLSTIKLVPEKYTEILDNHARSVMFNSSKSAAQKMIDAIKRKDPEIAYHDEFGNILRELYETGKESILLSELKERIGDEYKHLQKLLVKEGFKQKAVKNQNHWFINPDGHLEDDGFEDLTKDEDLGELG